MIFSSITWDCSTIICSNIVLSCPWLSCKNMKQRFANYLSSLWKIFPKRIIESRDSNKFERKRKQKIRNRLDEQPLSVFINQRGKEIRHICIVKRGAFIREVSSPPRFLPFKDGSLPFYEIVPLYRWFRGMKSF